MESTKPFRILISAARENARMNQREMAEYVGVDVSTVSSWEKGKTEPSVSQLRKISEASGIPMDYIFVPEQS